VVALDEAALNWGVKVLRYEIKDLTPPKEILHAMQAQITAEREKRALIAASEGRKQEQINIATGARARRRFRSPKASVRRDQSG
jgi:regulator of protease activity HflC (stomatin/prohibitin superfamily)